MLPSGSVDKPTPREEDGAVPVADEVAMREGGLANYNIPDSMVIHRAHGAPVRGDPPQMPNGNGPDAAGSQASTYEEGGSIRPRMGLSQGLSPGLSVTAAACDVEDEVQPGQPMGLPRVVRESEPYRDETLVPPGGLRLNVPQSNGGGAVPNTSSAGGTEVRAGTATGAAASGRGSQQGSSQKKLLAARDSLGQPPLVDFSGNNGGAMGASANGAGPRPSRAKGLRRSRRQPRELGESKFQPVNRSLQPGTFMRLALALGGVGHELDSSAMLYAVAQDDQARVQTLLDQGVDVNVSDYDRRTAAHLASSSGLLGMLQLLSEVGADLNALDRWGGTPLDDAIVEKNEECVAFLKSQGCKTGKRRLITNDDTAAEVDEERRVMSPESSLAKFLHAAAAGDIDTVRALIKKRGESIVSAADYDQRTALHVASSEGHLEVVNFLLEAGSLVNQRDRYGHTPLDEAAAGKHTECMEVIQAHGGETTGSYDTSLDNVSQDSMKLLERRGLKERWLLPISEVNIHSEHAFARGAGGELFLAKWRGLRVVVKSCANMVSNEQALVDLGNEISLLSTLRHPHLVLFLGAAFDTKHMTPLLVMEYCPGGTLEERIVRFASEGKAVPKREKIKYTYELALGMNFLHGCGIVHRDLKPSNVLLTATGDLKLTDFGLAKFIPAKNKKLGDKFSMTGETGSFRYMAPEVFKHEQYNEKVDVYSFSLIVYWMQTATRPFVQYTDPVAAVSAAALEEVRPKLPKNLEPGLRNLLSDAWSQQPEGRPSFEEIVTRLDEMGYESTPLNVGKDCVIS
ncbi:Protein kinase, putative [Hondaea fermentalgiana]|uniref:Protein kinase, putative n=1 Tax=Hondaea fermentalgiana TaxID=2315210 RepID=A0A2R5GVC5_9STRA|nr:Protein kinase, putative [Hondaea fermentalgiana]|eukprot:GBG34800.1 Protein kinase, putative [Hondaea fermentalgiana]